VDSRTGLQTIAAFASSYSPVLFTRETGGTMTVLPIAESRAWALTGTRIQSVAASRNASAVRLSLTVPGGFSENVSYFLYVFGSRAPGAANALTLELEPRAFGARGACLLWRKGDTAPRTVGTVSTTDTTVEVDFGADSGLLSAGENATVDLTAGWYNRSLGSWEEFYYTTFALSQIRRE